jgi:hypothetical protein
MGMAPGESHAAAGGFGPGPPAHPAARLPSPGRPRTSAEPRRRTEERTSAPSGASSRTSARWTPAGAERHVSDGPSGSSVPADAAAAPAGPERP